MLKKIITAAAVIAVISMVLTACSDGNCIMKVGKNRVSLDNYRYFYNTLQTYIFEEDFDTREEYEAKLMSEAENMLREYYSVFELAREQDIALSSEDKTVISNTYDYYVEQYGGKESFEQAMAEEQSTPELFRSVLEMRYLKQKLYDTLTDEYMGNIRSDDATVESDIEKNFVRATHILIMNDEGESAEANRALAEDILAKINAGGDFDALVSEYNEDSGMPQDGYCFTHGEMLEPFEEAAFALDEGRVSGIVESIYGYHIIKRLPLDEEYINDHFEEIRESFITREFNSQLQSTADGFEITYTSSYDKLTADDFE